MIPRTSGHDVAPAATKRTPGSHRPAPQPWWCLCRGRRGGTEGRGCWWQGVGLPWLGEVAEASFVTNLPGWDCGCEGQGLPTHRSGSSSALLAVCRNKRSQKENLLLYPSAQRGTRQERTCKCQLVNEINRKFPDFLSRADGFPIRAPLLPRVFCCGSSPRSARSYLFPKQF